MMDCISHIRILSWILLGALAYSIIPQKPFNSPSALPIPQEASCYIADHVIMIFSNFSCQYRSLVGNLSSLFYGFNLCQVCISFGLFNYIFYTTISRNESRFS